LDKPGMYGHLDN